MKCDHICKECGKHECGGWLDNVAAKLTQRQLCHTCDFWHEKIGIKDDPATVRAKGVHYRIGKEGVRGLFQGFGGARFRIRFNDGREVESTNLWCQGHIPDAFKERLPDNAEFLYEGA